MRRFKDLYLHKKILLLVILIVLVISLSFSIMYGIDQSQSIRSEVENNLYLTNMYASAMISSQYTFFQTHLEEFSKILVAYFNYSESLIDQNYVEEFDLVNFQAMSYLAKFYYEANMGFSSLYVDYAPEIYGKVQGSWMVALEDELIYNYKEIEDYSLSDFYPSNPDMDWYYLPKENKQAMWLDVYEDLVLGNQIISYVIPLITNEDVFFGVLGVDIALDMNRNCFETFDISFVPDIIILDSNKEFIKKPKGDFSQEFFDLFIHEQFSSPQGYVSYRNGILFFNTLENGQVVISLYNISYFQDAIVALWSKIILIILSVIALSLFLSIIIVKKITKELHELKNIALEVKKGNYSKLATVNSTDEIGELAMAFNQAITSLSQLDKERKTLDKAKTEFLSITSHELRSPMTPMKAQLQMLQGNYFGKLNKKQEQSVEIVLRNTQRLDGIIVDFLEISRLEAARLKFNFMFSDLSEMIHLLVAEMKGFIPEKKIDFITRIQKPLMVETDPERVSQVLRNLLTNAIKFSNIGGTIEITAKKTHDEVFFSVKDNGVGIKKDSQVRIFEPFFQADNMYQHRSGGTGLGLAICKGIVTSQNGRIWFESVENKGTVFNFTLPLKPVKEMRNIKVLFSSKQAVEEQLKKLFSEMLGPIGEIEFDDLRLKGLIKEDILAYVDFLKENHIISKTKDFKKSINDIFNGA